MLAAVDLAWVSASAVAVASAFGAWLGWRSKQVETESSSAVDMARFGFEAAQWATTTAHDEMERLRAEVERLRAEVEECEKHRDVTEAELVEVRKALAELHRQLP